MPVENLTKNEILYGIALAQSQILGVKIEAGRLKNEGIQITSFLESRSKPTPWWIKALSYLTFTPIPHPVDQHTPSLAELFLIDVRLKELAEEKEVLEECAAYYTDKQTEKISAVDSTIKK